VSRREKSAEKRMRGIWGMDCVRQLELRVVFYKAWIAAALGMNSKKTFSTSRIASESLSCLTYNLRLSWTHMVLLILPWG
jgi:hypothetical protein